MTIFIHYRLIPQPSKVCILNWNKIAQNFSNWYIESCYHQEESFFENDDIIYSFSSLRFSSQWVFSPSFNKIFMFFKEHILFFFIRIFVQLGFLTIDVWGLVFLLKVYKETIIIINWVICEFSPFSHVSLSSSLILMTYPLFKNKFSGSVTVHASHNFDMEPRSPTSL